MADHVAVLGVLLVLALLYLQMAEPAPPRRRRRTVATSPAGGGGAPPSGAAGILGRIRWDTISRMLHWRAQMNRLDNILDSVTVTTPPPGDSAPSGSP